MSTFLYQSVSFEKVENSKTQKEKKHGKRNVAELYLEWIKKEKRVK